MYKCKLADTSDDLKFQQMFCRTETARQSIIQNFKVEVEAFEELPPWYSVYNADGSDYLLKDSIIMLKVSDLQKRICFFPVFSENIGRRLLRCWHIALPPKMTVFMEDSNVSEAKIHAANKSLRNLLAFARIFMFPQSRLHTPMPYGFNNIYMQLHKFPEMGVASETIRLINEILGEYIDYKHDGRYSSCDNLQDFIEYIKGRYSLLHFKESDFSLLRTILLSHYPKDKVRF